MVKGKSEPITLFNLIDVKKQQAIRLQEPQYALPMVGRQTELALIAEKIDQMLTGKGQVVGIFAEAGMGKSRLVAEEFALLQRKICWVMVVNVNHTVPTPAIWFGKEFGRLSSI